MLDLYFAPTPNGWKITIMLEECGLAYNLKPVNLGKGDQFKPEFLNISPNNRMPAIVDFAAPGGPISDGRDDGRAEKDDVRADGSECVARLRWPYPVS